MKLRIPPVESRPRPWPAVPSSTVSLSSAFFLLLGLVGFPATAQTNPANPAQTNPNDQSHGRTAPPAPPQAVSPHPAAVTMKDGTLTVKANNSDLGQILRDVSRESGMVLEGPVRDVRVYGNYGPENPSAILTELLAGLGYNILMVGSAREGAPGKLILSARVGGPSPPDTTPQKIEEPQLGPGAIAHPPPSQPDDPQVRAQQNLQRLQQMHDAHPPENAPH